MSNEYKTTRVWAKTLRNLKRAAAETGESVVALLDRLAEQEVQRVIEGRSIGRNSMTGQKQREPD